MLLDSAIYGMLILYHNHKLLYEISSEQLLLNIILSATHCCSYKMTTNERLPLIDNEIKSAGDQEQSQTEAQEGYGYVAITASDSSHRRNLENAQSGCKPLSNLARVCCTKVRSKFKNNRCCLWSSKAVILILVWNLIISIGMGVFLDPSLYTITIADIVQRDQYMLPAYDSFLMLFGLSYGSSALLLIFYPPAGCLADLRWGRYITVRNSLRFLLLNTSLTIILIGVALLGFTPMITNSGDLFNDNTIITILTIVLLSIIFGFPILFGIVLFFCSIVSFSANVIQFGLDQLHDAPMESLSLYIHWYVWTSQVGRFLIRVPSVVHKIYYQYFFLKSLVYISSPVLILLALVLLGVTLCLEKYKRHWFLIEPGSTNPYKLVYKVIKFAKDHTNPIRRSAFTYCEDELPSRFDLGKEKYGGPFTTEEVENVKAFLGILRVLLAVGPTFFVEFAFSENLPGLLQVATFNTTLVSSYPYFYTSGCLVPLLILVLIPLYLCLLRPFIYDYIPGMLKRMGLGMLLLLLSGVCTLVVGVARNNVNCVPTLYYGIYLTECGLGSYFDGVNSNFLIIQFILNALSYLLLYVSAFEFICAQSPHSMKGLLIGTFFAIKGVFQLLSVLLLYTPINAKCNQNTVTNNNIVSVQTYAFPVCGFIYHFINVVIALIGIIVFTIIAKRYEYRQRDEPDNIYRYAEEYYANARDEPNYDYDDYDNLNVETID